MKAAERGEDIQPEQVGYRGVVHGNLLDVPWLVANVSPLGKGNNKHTASESNF